MSKEKPLISIALCTYNGAEFLVQQLESILSQSYNNIEIIIVDDCSTDDTLSIITKYECKDPRIKIYKNAKNIGFNKNFGKAISLTNGDFIALSDQDDIWDINKITELFHAISDNWVVFSNSQSINSKGNLLDSFLLKDFRLEKQNYTSLLLNNYVTGHTSLIKREALDYILPFPEQGFYDWWIGFSAIYHGKLRYLNKVLTNYRIHPNSIVQTMGSSSSFEKIHSDEKCRLIIQLNCFLKYPHLMEEDKKSINGILNAVIQQRTGYSWPLFKIIVTQYSVFFSNKKPRKLFSRVNFARRFFRAM
jgi:glycosyltransferase involved in cell wall biosynthesis